MKLVRHIRKPISMAAEPTSSKAPVAAFTSPAQGIQITEQCTVPATGFVLLTTEILQQIMERCESGDVLRLSMAFPFTPRRWHPY